MGVGIGSGNALASCATCGTSTIRPIKRGRRRPVLAWKAQHQGHDTTVRAWPARRRAKEPT